MYKNGTEREVVVVVAAMLPLPPPIHNVFGADDDPELVRLATNAVTKTGEERANARVR